MQKLPGKVLLELVFVTLKKSTPEWTSSLPVTIDIKEEKSTLTVSSLFPVTVQTIEGWFAGIKILKLIISRRPGVMQDSSEYDPESDVASHWNGGMEFSLFCPQHEIIRTNYIRKVQDGLLEMHTHHTVTMLDRPSVCGLKKESIHFIGDQQCEVVINKGEAQMSIDSFNGANAPAIITCAPAPATASTPTSSSTATNKAGEKKDEKHALTISYE